MHILNQIQNIHIQACQPVQHQIILVHDFIIVQVFRSDGSQLRTNLHMIALLVQELFILAAIDGIQQGLGKIGTGPEELHLFAGLGSRNAAADAVIIRPDRPHDIIVFILDRRCLDRDAGCIAPEVQRQAG